MKPVWAHVRRRETVNCEICDGSEFELLASTDLFGSGLPTVLCRGCGLVFTCPRMPDDIYAAFYARDYRRLYRLSPHDDLGAAEPRWERYRSVLGTKPRLLDVGAGDALFSALVHQRLPYATVVAIEPDRQMASAARERGGIEVFACRVEDAPLPAHSQTHAAVFHVLEHVTHPAAFLLQLNRLLEPGGKLLVEVPNIAGPWSGIAMLHPAHIYQYTPHTLDLLLRRAGFRSDDMQVWDYAPIPLSMSVIATKLEEPTVPMPVAVMPPDVEQIKQQFADRLCHVRRDILIHRVKKQAAGILGPRNTAWVREAFGRVRSGYGS